MSILIAGNWKMNMTPDQSIGLIDGIRAGVSETARRTEVLICPPFTGLSLAATRLAGSGIRVGAQNMHPEPRGAFTGEISAEILLSVGCTHVICGHSERRHIMHEGDDLIHRKVAACILNNLQPILCVGETEQERNQDLTRAVVERQLKLGLSGIDSKHINPVIVAYEPVWAIGTGKTATPAQAQEVHEFLRNLLDRMYPGTGQSVRILYGGSVTPENSLHLLSQPDIDGALVGGASLKVDSFLGIIRTAEAAAK